MAPKRKGTGDEKIPPAVEVVKPCDFRDLEPLEVIAACNPSTQSVDFWIRSGDTHAPAAFSLPTKIGAAQALMDSLYRAGLRPSDEGSIGERDAMREHIKDLRMYGRDLLTLHICQRDRAGELSDPPRPPEPFTDSERTRKL